MSDQTESLYWDAVRLASDRQVEAFVEKAREFKKVNYDVMMEANRRSSVIDTLVAQLAPGIEWQGGWWDGYSPVRQPIISYPEPGRVNTEQRAQRILGLAKSMTNKGEETVSTRKIAEQLQREGHGNSLRSLAVATGNVLAKNGWLRVREGLYRRDSAKEEDA